MGQSSEVLRPLSRRRQVQFAAAAASALAFAACVPKSSTEPAAAETPARPETPPGPVEAQPLAITFRSAPAVVAAPIPHLRRGINLGNGFDAPKIGEWGVILEDAHFELAADAGLDHVRLPIRFSAEGRAAKEAPYTIPEEFFEKIDWAIANALSRNLAIIVDLHHYEELMERPDLHIERTLAIWKQVAARYKDQPDTVLFELLNEPCNKLTPDVLNQLYSKLIPLIRQTNPERTLIVDSFFWAAANYLKALQLPDDPNIAVSWHMYQPILFTHQGASWMDPEFQSRGIVFPGPAPAPAARSAAADATGWTRAWLDRYDTEPAETNPSSPAAVAAEFDMATAYAKETGRGVYLGEFGAIDFADPTSRENYLRLVRMEAERRGMAWAIWDDGGRNRAMDVKKRSWVEPVARALFTDEPGMPLPDLSGETGSTDASSPGLGGAPAESAAD